MLTIALSENAVAELRFRVKGWKMPVTECRLQALRELVDAGIMEPADGDFRFSEDGWARREELLHEAEERIERERFEPPDPGHLSEAARELLRRRLAGDQEVTDANRAAYRELAAARIMIPCHTFIGGWESAFKFTSWGWKRRFELAGMNCVEEDA
jgi:hypothetical protein